MSPVGLGTVGASSGGTPGLLDKERTIAAPGFNRWLVPPAALWGGWLERASPGLGGSGHFACVGCLQDALERRQVLQLTNHGREPDDDRDFT
jgi:hypothetical protein